MKINESDLRRICEHEISHGIVAIIEGYTDFCTIFVDLITPKTDRRGGLDINIDNLRERFDTDVPVADRRSLARQLIAIFAAGSAAEKMLYGNAVPEWSSWDDKQIEWFGTLGVYEESDVDLLNSIPSRDNNWPKWASVDKLVNEGRQRAAESFRPRRRLPILLGCPTRASASVSCSAFLLELVSAADAYAGSVGVVALTLGALLRLTRCGLFRDRCCFLRCLPRTSMVCLDDNACRLS